MKWTPSQFRKPRTGDKPLMVEFRNGVIGGPYTSSQIRWSDSGHDFDVVKVARA